MKILKILILQGWFLFELSNVFGQDVLDPYQLYINFNDPSTLPNQVIPANFPQVWNNNFPAQLVFDSHLPPATGSYIGEYMISVKKLHWKNNSGITYTDFPPLLVLRISFLRMATPTSNLVPCKMQTNKILFNFSQQPFLNGNIY